MKGIKAFHLGTEIHSDIQVKEIITRIQPLEKKSSKGYCALQALFHVKFLIKLCYPVCLSFLFLPIQLVILTFSFVDDMAHGTVPKG